MKKKLMSHNQMAADKIIESTKKGLKNILYVSGVGTGKSYVTKYLIETLYRNKKIVYVVPKHSIADYLKKEAGFERYENVFFCTYNYFSNKSKCLQLFRDNDLVVLDEAHHVGSCLYGNNIVYAMHKYETNVLGLTATPLRDSDKVDIGSFFDITIKGLSNFDAIRSGLMPKFEYIVCTPGSYKQNKNDKVVLDYDNSDELLSDIVKTNKKDKWLCFFPNTAKLEAHRELIRELFPDYHVSVLYASLDNTEEVLKEVRENKKCVVLSCNILLEGLHIDNVDGIILFRDVESLTVFQQILGRVCSIGKKKSPIVVDCTEVAYKMMKKLMREEKTGMGRTRSPRNMEHNILRVSLENKKFHDISRLLWMSTNYAGFAFRDVEYSSLYAACNAYGLNRQRVVKCAWENDIYPEEAMELLLKEGKTVQKRVKIEYGGRQYKSVSALCKEFGYEPDRVSARAKSLGITVPECIKGLLNGIYELPEKEGFIVDGICYKNMSEFSKKNNISSSTIHAFARRMGVSNMAAAESLLKKGHSRNFIYKGVKYPSFKACCKHFGVGESTIHENATASGRTKQEELDRAIDNKKKREATLNVCYINGIEYSLCEFSREFHISRNTVRRLEAKGLSRQEAMDYLLKERT